MNTFKKKLLLSLVSVLIINSLMINQSIAKDDLQSYKTFKSKVIKTFYPNAISTDKINKRTPTKEEAQKEAHESKFNEILPNPVVYLYGKCTNNDPLLLMVFSSTIPIDWLDYQKTSNLNSITLKLSIKEQLGYYYKILDISADQVAQTVAYSNSSTISPTASFSVSPTIGAITPANVSSSLSAIFNDSMVYNTELPLITSSGVGSDTLTIMLKRGKKYPIQNGQIKVYMLVRAIKKPTKNDDIVFSKENFDQLKTLIDEINGKDLNTIIDNTIMIDNNINDEGNQPEVIHNIQSNLWVDNFMYKSTNDFTLNKYKYKEKYPDKDSLIRDLKNSEKEYIKSLSKNKQIKDLLGNSSNIYNILDTLKTQFNTAKKYKTIGDNALEFITNIPSNQKLFSSVSKKEKDITTSQGQNILSAYKEALALKETISSLEASYEDLKTVIKELWAYNEAINLVQSGKNINLNKYVETTTIASKELPLIAEEDLKKYFTPNNLIQSNAKATYLIDKTFENKKQIKTSKELLNKIIAKCNIQDETYGPIDTFDKFIKGYNLNELINIYRVMDTNGELQEKLYYTVDKKEKEIKSISEFMEKYHNGEFDEKPFINKDGYYQPNYMNFKKRIMLVYNLYEGLNNEVDLINLVKNNDHVDLIIDKNISHTGKIKTIGNNNLKLKQWPFVLKTVAWPLDQLLSPKYQNEKNYDNEFHSYKMSRIMPGSYFDKDFKEEDYKKGYTGDDKLIYKQMNEKLNPKNLTPSITSPQTGGNISVMDTSIDVSKSIEAKSE